MLAYRSQPIHLPPSPSPSHSSRSNYFNTLPYTSCSPSPNELNEKALRNYLEANPQLSASQLAFFTDSELPLPASSLAANNYSLQNPDIRIQQSTPTPTPNLSNAFVADGNAWGNMYAQTAGHLAPSPSLQTPMMKRRSRGHQRAASSSSTGSSGSSAQYSNAFPYVSGSDSSPTMPNPILESLQTTDKVPRTFSNHHLPTPSQTPTQDSFVSTAFPTYTSQPSALDSMAAHMALKQALLDGTAGEDDLPGFAHSARHSVSSYGQDSPSTPRTAHGEDSDDKYRLSTNGEAPEELPGSWVERYLLLDDAEMMRQNIPKFNRTMTDVYQDELFNPANAAHNPPPSSQAANSATLLSPYRNIISERLQEANQARSLSPASSTSRDVSPFRQNSSMFDNFSAAQARLAANNAMIQQRPTQQRMTNPKVAEPKTISPQEALLDYNPTDADAQMPLFPDARSSDYEAQYAVNGVTHGPTSSGITQNGIVTSAPAPPQTNFTFAAPSVPGPFRGLPQFPNTHAYRAVSSISTAPESTPEFPAHLTSMESSASEAGPPDSSQGSEIQKPTATHADTGTYTCTYHGCTLRFETPQKLQRHKREGHRNAIAATPIQATPPGVGSGMTSAALLARNSQAGPHKCERINPTTGKPCNTIFSRPYDLTRHEDTIHNIRKQKVRCALCVEEKTFSRNDALTRHMRVVHPEVDFPGKHRRRGGNHE